VNFFIEGFVAGNYTRDECHLDLRQMSSFGSVRFIRAEVCGIDTTKKMIFVKGDRPPITYDIVSINIGITPKLDVSGAAEAIEASITPVKPIDGFAVRFEQLLVRVRQSNGTFRVAIVGGGAGGCELALTMNKRFRDELVSVGKDPNLCKFTLYNRGPEVMASHSK
jgi:selenide, water dikinase